MSAFDENNLEHERAEYAYKCIKDVLSLNIKDKYRSEVLQTSARIYNSGLMQTLTFYCSKMNDNEHFRKLSLHLMKWILRDELTTNQETWTENDSQTWQLLNTIMKRPNSLVLYTERAKAITIWLKRFAEGMIEKPRG